MCIKQAQMSELQVRNIINCWNGQSNLDLLLFSFHFRIIYVWRNCKYTETRWGEDIYYSKDNQKRVEWRHFGKVANISTPVCDDISLQQDNLFCRKYFVNDSSNSFNGHGRTVLLVSTFENHIFLRISCYT